MQKAHGQNYYKAILTSMWDVCDMNIVQDIDYPEVQAASVVLGYGAASKKNASCTLPPLEEETTMWHRNVGK